MRSSRPAMGCQDIGGWRTTMAILNIGCVDGILDAIIRAIPAHELGYTVPN